jgi:hypothetical protein
LSSKGWAADRDNASLQKSRRNFEGANTVELRLDKPIFDVRGWWCVVSLDSLLGCTYFLVSIAVVGGQVAKPHGRSVSQLGGGLQKMFTAMVSISFAAYASDAGFRAL